MKEVAQINSLLRVYLASQFAALMDIYELADIIKEDIIVRRYAGQSNRWTARFEHAEVKEGAGLTSEYGNATSPEGAIADYARRISGKLLVFNAFNKADRREISAPVELTS